MLHVYIKFHPNLYKTLGNILVKYKHAEKNKKNGQNTYEFNRRWSISHYTNLNRIPNPNRYRRPLLILNNTGI